jgi:hypothetical protein
VSREPMSGVVCTCEFTCSGLSVRKWRECQHAVCRGLAVYVWGNKCPSQSNGPACSAGPAGSAAAAALFFPLRPSSSSSLSSFSGFMTETVMRLSGSG